MRRITNRLNLVEMLQSHSTESGEKTPVSSSPKAGQPFTTMNLTTFIASILPLLSPYSGLSYDSYVHLRYHDKGQEACSADFHCA